MPVLAFMPGPIELIVIAVIVGLPVLIVVLVVKATTGRPTEVQTRPPELMNPPPVAKPDELDTVDEP